MKINYFFTKIKYPANSSREKYSLNSLSSISPYILIIFFISHQLKTKTLILMEIDTLSSSNTPPFSFPDLLQCNGQASTDSPTTQCSFNSVIEGSLMSPGAVAALRVQKVYRSYRTRRKLADTAVVVEELWYNGVLFHLCHEFFEIVSEI